MKYFFSIFSKNPKKITRIYFSAAKF